ncbi:MAG: SRPBCC family protein [Chloroflexota bacterium]
MSHTITKSIIVKSDVATVYEIWSNFDLFPTFMKRVKSVRKVNETVSHWTIDAPLGIEAEWVAEMTRADENKRIAWNTKSHDGDIVTSGEVTFNALPDGQTEVTLVFQYTPPGGVVGRFAAKVLTMPEAILDEELRNFKNYAEGRYERLPRS